jgi:hypothetical protein
MPRGFSKGFYKPRHPEKYKGDVNKIVYRSSWELDFCRFLDNNQRVIEWASEPFFIPYVKPTDKREHKYFPDFWIKYISKDGEIIQEVIEIKPASQMVAPNPTGKKPKQQLYEGITYAINVAKWKAATDFCAKYGMKFRLMNENTLFK